MHLANKSPLGHCALLFGLPVSRKAFERACKRTPRSDYLTHLIGDDPEEAWSESYSQIVSAAEELMGVASDGEAAVYPESTLAHLAAATERASVVILMAHFRGFDFSEADLLVPAGMIAETIANRQVPVLGNFDPALREPWLLVDAFNSAIMDRKLLRYLPESLANAGERTCALGRVLCRDLLDEALDGMIRPGNRLELFDGLHTPGDVAGAIGERFRGELDLALCNSAALATVIDLRRHNQIHHVHWPDLVHPVPQLVLAGKALTEVARHGGSYIQARLELEREILKIDWRTP